MIIIETFERWRQPRGPPHATPTNRETRAMTRHGMVQPSAAGAPPPATDPRASMVTVAADRVATSQRAGPATPRGGATKRPVRIHPHASQRRSRHRRHRPQIEIPIAIDCGPRVPA